MNQPIVFVVEDGKAVMREVQTGIQDATHIEVVSGLSGGETVVSGPFRLLRTELADGVCPVEADRAQLESALLNVAVNARDAMPDGGDLLICTTSHDGGEDGSMIAVSVRDSGVGMDEETLGRALEAAAMAREEFRTVPVTVTFEDRRQHTTILQYLLDDLVDALEDGAPADRGRALSAARTPNRRIQRRNLNSGARYETFRLEHW